MQSQPPSLVTNGDAARAAEVAVQNYRQQASDLRREQEAVMASMREISGRVTSLCADIALRALPTVDRETVMTVSAEFGALRLVSVYDTTVRGIAEQERIRVSCEADPRYADAPRLIENYGAELDRLRLEHDALRGELTRFERSDDFQEVLRSRQPVLPPTGGEILWHWFAKIFFLGFLWQPALERAKLLEKRQREERVKEEFENILLDAIVDRYEVLPSELSRVAALHVRVKADKQGVSDLAKRHSDAVTTKARLEEDFPNDLDAAFMSYLEACTEWLEIRKQARPEFRLTIATIITLREKLRCLEQMKYFLGREACDRDTRMNDIQKVIPKLRRNPSTRLRKDPTTWLHTAPTRMAQRTAASVSGVHAMHQTVYVYDRYDAVDRFADTYSSFMLWDMIAHDHCGHVPSLGFAHMVMPDLAAFHAEHPESVAQMDAAFEEAGIEPVDAGGGFEDAGGFAADQTSFDAGSFGGSFDTGGFDGADTGGGFSSSDFGSSSYDSGGSYGSSDFGGGGYDGGGGGCDGGGGGGGGD